MLIRYLSVGRHNIGICLLYHAIFFLGRPTSHLHSISHTISIKMQHTCNIRGLDLLIYTSLSLKIYFQVKFNSPIQVVSVILICGCYFCCLRLNFFSLKSYFVFIYISEISNFQNIYSHSIMGFIIVHGKNMNKLQNNNYYFNVLLIILVQMLNESDLISLEM